MEECSWPLPPAHRWYGNCRAGSVLGGRAQPRSLGQLAALVPRGLPLPPHGRVKHGTQGAELCGVVVHRGSGAPQSLQDRGQVLL